MSEEFMMFKEGHNHSMVIGFHPQCPGCLKSRISYLESELADRENEITRLRESCEWFEARAHEVLTRAGV